MHENGIDRHTVMKMTGLCENDLAQIRRCQKSELRGGKPAWDMIIKTRKKIILDMIFTNLLLNHTKHNYSRSRTLSDRACRMDEEMTFSLSYEQLLHETEAPIKKRNISRTGEFYVREKPMASDILMFWHSLALRSYLGIPDTERIDADWQRLNAYIENEGQVL